MIYKVDFHMHSIYSDGEKLPVELVWECKQKGLDQISITDHDNITGQDEADFAARRLGIQYKTGIEISSRYFHKEMQSNGINTDELHILGYGFSLESEALNRYCNSMLEDRIKRAEQMAAALRVQGMEITVDEIIEVKKDKMLSALESVKSIIDLGDENKQKELYELIANKINKLDRIFIGRPDFAKIMIDNGIAKDINHAFNEYLNRKNLKTSMDRELLPAEGAIDIIKQSGGSPVLAHPMELFKDNMVENRFQILDSILRELKGFGLNGLEVFHPSATAEDSMQLIKLAEKYHLHMTEGSDRHS